jgi:hypothetical protein
MSEVRTFLSTRKAIRSAMCVASLLCLPVTAHAYLDPGMGSILFQSLLAVVFGFGVALRQVRHWLARFWAFILRRPPPSPSDTDKK